jgi:Peptidase family M23/FG-GAP-like repeat/Secretion system C-terminal sorting domain
VYPRIILLFVLGLFVTQEVTATPQFMTLPYNQDNVVLQQGWTYMDGGTHRGIDWHRNWEPFNVVACHDGEATYFGDCEAGDAGCNGGLGNYVRIRKNISGTNYYTLYCHLQSSPLPVGTPVTVSAGQFIGVTGVSGAANDVNHLHFEYHEESVGNKKDPYDIYANRDSYPPSGGNCGASNSWITCPPTMYTFICSKLTSSISPAGPYIPGQTITCQVKFKNEGTATWSKTPGSSYVELGSCNSGGTIGYSFFNYPCTLPNSGQVATWSHCWVPGNFAEASVAPGGTATFNFTGKIRDIAPGTYDVYFGPVFDGSIMQGWGQMKFTVQVIEYDPPLLSGTSFTPLVADFNGDGKDDICLYAPATGNWYVALSNGTNAFTPTPGTTGQWISNWKSTGGPYTPFAADFSGDGYADIALMRQSIGRWYVAFNWDDHFTQANGTATDNSWLADGWGESPYISMVADMSNDGYPDVCLYHPTYGRWFVAYNWNDHFTGVAGPYDGGSWLTNWKTTGGTYLPFAAELSGDGYTDVALLRTSVGRWYVGFNDATPTPPDLYQANGTATDNSWLADSWGESPYVSFVRDFSGDGYADVCLFHPTLGRWFVAFNWSNHFAGAAGPYTGGSWIDNWKTSASGTYIPLVGDFSGDGYTDICLYEPATGKWHVAFNWNDRFTQANGTYDGAWLDGWGVVTGGGGKLVGNSSDNSSELPETFFLSQNYPNPFNPATSISFTLPKATHVSLEVYNILGQRVAQLVDADLPAGNHNSVWEADKQASGIYFYRLRTEDADVTKKMVLMK